MIGWWDIDEDQIGGAAKIASIDYEPDSNGHYKIELSSATLWEKSGKTIAEDDPIFFVTTPDIAAHHFDYSYNKSANGIGTIVAPDGNYTTVFGISETDYPRWAPFRRQSVTFDHLEVTSFWLRLGAKRGFDVTPATDISITHPAVVEQLARGLMAFQQQAYTGGQLQGGYPTDNSSGNTEGVAPAAALVIGGKPIYADGFFYHDVFVTIPKDDLYRVEVGGEADYWQGDGSRWSRMADYDGKDGFVAHYMNNVHCNRGGIGALTGITVDVNYLDYSPGVPNHV